ncbi:transposase [uncultured Chryseobacterium sp.]|uniref:transposase n=1 Tax=uncultured Chryseobacterium sp. TaxID=259322 RepID=UPI0025D1A554|nr:transposase [uncultured Chryseobacterium sp.]
MGDTRITSLEPDKYYHIYNRGINGATIFKTDRNKDFFLQKVEQLLLPVCNVYCYCLLSNHFHLLVKIKPENELNSLVKVQNLDKAIKPEKGLHAIHNIFSKQFSRVFNSYSQAFNRENSRHGALIESPFRRKEIVSEDYMRKVAIYIHQNPQLHLLTDDFRKFKYSSYQYILNNDKTFLSSYEVTEWFDNTENFISCHDKITDEIEF